MSGITNCSLRRRTLLGAGIAGTLVLGFRLPLPARAGEAAAAGTALNAFVALDEAGTVIVQSPYIEMGQGTYTSIPALVAEEMDLPLAQVRVEQAPPGPEYRLIRGNSTRFTGGSRSIRSAFEPLRRAGATARDMLVRAAAARWQVPAAELSTAGGEVRHAGSGRAAGYGTLAAEAAALAPAGNIALKPAGQFSLLGTPARRLDVPAKTDGSAEFGIDAAPPGLCFAAIRQAPVYGGEVEAVDAERALSMPGVQAVERISNAVAVLGRGYWHAERALDAMNIRFTAGPAPEFDSEAHARRVRAALAEPGIPGEEHGQDAAAAASAEGGLSADYLVPFLAHVTMEPQNCTALVTADSCTVWAPNQGVDRVVAAAKEVTGLAEEAITVHTPYLGGGFGRRFNPDFVVQALEIAVRHKGTPIRLVWSREQDTRHDFYRPAIAARYRASLGPDGLPAALHATIAGDGPTRRHFPGAIEEGGFDPSVLEGAMHASYAIARRRIDYVYVETPPPIGYWRSVGNSHNAFFKESFIDEMAHAAGSDPLEYRRRLLQDAPRVRKVLDAAAGMAGWRAEPWTEGGTRKAHGIAVHEAYDTIVAQVAEVSLDAGEPRVHRVCCAVDCGFAVNPAIVTMQMESAIAYGLSAALHERVTMKQGRTQEGNFDDYPILAAAEMPRVAVEIIDSGEQVGGIGEPGTPPIAPAVCNALFALTGERIRSLPIGKVST